MTKTLIIVIMEGFVIKKIITVIKFTYRRNRLEKKRKQTNKLDLIKKLVRFARIEMFLLLMSQILNGSTIPGMDRWEILILSSDISY